MSSATIDARTRSYEDSPSNLDEQQALLQGGQPEPRMGSDVIKPEGRRGDGSAYIIVGASYAVFVLTTWIVVFSNDPASLGWFKYHPLFQSLSIGCFTYGVLTLQPTSQPPTKAAGLKRHQIAMMGLGVPILLLGTLAEVVQKINNNSSHFTSLHGRCGLVAVLWIVVQALFGGTTVWFGGAAWGGGMRPKLLWKYHRLSGYIVFPLLLFTAYLGGSKWVGKHTDSFVSLLAFPIALFIILAGVYSRVRPSKMKFF